MAVANGTPIVTTWGQITDEACDVLGFKFSVSTMRRLYSKHPDMPIPKLGAQKQARRYAERAVFRAWLFHNKLRLWSCTAVS